MSIVDRYREWRHIWGYGVHSPYAYMLVTEILNLPRGYSYYDEKNVTRSGVPRRLALAMKRFEWKFGVVPAMVDADKFLSAVCDAKIPVVVLNPPDTIIKDIEAGVSTGVLFYSKKAVMYFPNSKVRFVSYEYMF